MYFQKIVSLENIMKWVQLQIPAVMNGSEYGIDIEIKQHKKTRSYQQNRYLMAVMQAIVKFYLDTGFRPYNLESWAMRTDVLKEFWKAHFGIKETHKLTTKEMVDFVDGIQAIMIEQSHGEYVPIIPEDLYIESLTRG